VPETRGYKTGRLLNDRARGPAPHCGGVALEIDDRLPNGLVMRGPHLRAQGLIADAE
jgi:hypothetical protein